MAINAFNIKKWYKMITKKSILHVEQPVGHFYNKNKIKGYYNDLREKVIKSGLQEKELPKTELPNGEKIDFPIAIFQYGLGAYDLYIETNDKKYFSMFENAAVWAINNQEENGAWATFEHESVSNPYSSMAQGEGVSLLLRYFIETKQQEYLDKSKLAIGFLKENVKYGGCTLYDNNDIYLKEFPQKPTVLNGWIFSLFGIYDYYLATNEKEEIDFFNKSIETMKKVLPKYDIGYWSKYDIDKKIASPFYHKLHINLLYVLYDLTGDDVFKHYAEKFKKYQTKRVNRIHSFAKKAMQKVFER